MQEEKKVETKEEKKKKKDKKILITTIVTSVVIIAGLVTAIIFLLREPPLEVVIEYDRTPTGGRGIVVTEDNVDEIRDMLAQPIEDGYYEVHISKDWTFPRSGNRKGDAYFKNLETNTRTVFFDLYLEDRNQVIFVSPYIPLGRDFRNFALDVDLPVGTYETLLTIFLVDDNNTIITEVRMRIPITITN